MLTIVDRAAERGFIDNLPEVLDTLLNSTPYYAGKEVLKVVHPEIPCAELTPTQVVVH
jgi:hypothetical protein